MAKENDEKGKAEGQEGKAEGQAKAKPAVKAPRDDAELAALLRK